MSSTNTGPCDLELFPWEAWIPVLPATASGQPEKDPALLGEGRALGPTPGLTQWPKACLCPSGASKVPSDPGTPSLAFQVLLPDKNPVTLASSPPT